MSDGRLLIRVFDGARSPFPGDVLISLFDGVQRRVHWAHHSTPFTMFTIPLTDGPLDVFRVVAGAPKHRDAGQLGITLKQDTLSIVNLMLLPQRADFVFQPLATLKNIHQKLFTSVTGFLKKQNLTADDKGYKAFQEKDLKNREGLATLLSIASGFDGFGAGENGGSALAPPIAFGHHPLEYVDELISLEPDRFFAKASSDMTQWLSSDNDTFHIADHSLHPDAFLSFKEQRYPEGNVQFTFAQTESNPKTFKLDGDIDLFRDLGSHFFLEVVPSDFLHVIDHTDPRDAYAFRWMSVQRAKAASGLDFNPPYSVVPE